MYVRRYVQKATCHLPEETGVQQYAQRHIQGQNDQHLGQGYDLAEDSTPRDNREATCRCNRPTTGHNGFPMMMMMMMMMMITYQPCPSTHNILSGTAEAGTETNDLILLLTSFNLIAQRQPYKHKIIKVYSSYYNK